MKSAQKAKVTEIEECSLSTKDIYRVLDLYFYRKFHIYKHSINSYDKFLDEDIVRYLLDGTHVFSESIQGDTVYRNRFKFENIKYESPTFDNQVDPIFPSDARHKSLTYSVTLLADVTQLLEIKKTISKDGFESIKIGETVQNVPVGYIPLMVRSKYCNLTKYKGIDNKECDYDPGCHFLVKGSEKIVIAQDRMVENKPLVFLKKDSSSTSYVVQVNSRSYKHHGLQQSLTIKLRKDNIMTIRVPILAEVNVFILFRALGIESDRDIINYTTGNEYDRFMTNIVKTSLDSCKNEKGMYIKSKDDAIDYLVNKIKIIQKITETDNVTKMEQKKLHLMYLLKTNFIPHLSCDIRDKAIYLGYMINRLLRVAIGRLPIDDRDSYINKRVDLQGDLMFELFKQQYKKMINDCNKFFNNRMDDEKNPPNIIHNIKPNTIEQGFMSSLMTGSWIRRKGVAQMMQRLTYLQGISFLRRIDAPSGEASSQKLTSPRHLHPSSVAFLCVSGDTEIELDNGEIELIKNISNSFRVKSVYTDDLREENTEITNYFEIFPNKMLEITLLNGNKIKCTPDHPLLINDENGNTFLNSGKLKIKDNIVTRHSIKYIESEKLDNLEKLLITARLVGLFLSSGKSVLDEYNERIVEFTDVQNMKQLIDDIDKLGYWKDYETVKSNNLLVNGETAGYLVNNGCCTKSVPEWIFKSNLKIKREFLCGFFKIGKMQINKDVEKIFNEFGIKLLSKDEENYSIIKGFENSYENIYNLCKFISPKYCDKNEYSSISEYVKYRYNNNNLDDENALTLTEFIKTYKISDVNFKMPIVKIVEIEPEKVYDFTTVNEAHSFIGNGIVLSNCPIQTPEHAKVGLTKHLNLISSITIMEFDTFNNIKNYLEEYKEIKGISEIEPSAMKYMYKIFLNGDWIGIINGIPDEGKPHSENNIAALRLFNDIYSKKINGYFNTEMFSPVIDHDEFEIKIYCESGRLYRPVLKVGSDNNILLKKSHIDSISLNKTHQDKITDWDEFVIKNSTLIEYIDVESQPYQMVADKIETVNIAQRKMKNSVNYKFTGNDETDITNRYNDNFFLKYTHSEFHPSVLLGEIAVNIPYCDSNQGPRNIFQYSQGRQAMGIYATNYRDRLDISYILYTPQRPVVKTRASKYINTESLPFGENAIVAIGTYTGYNQEDSLIFNRRSIQRGLFRSTSLKKYSSSISKNQSTSQDDIFTKPDPDKVMGVRKGSYDKLNLHGYVPEETVVNNGDILLAKIKPIQLDLKSNSDKSFKDDSETYKVLAPGTVDRVYTDIFNEDLYETRKMLVRSERTPQIGDKFCCYTPDHEVLTDDGWIFFDNLNYKHKVATLSGTNELIYVNPTDIQKYSYTGPLYSVQSNEIDLLVTPNHRMYVNVQFNSYEPIYNAGRFEIRRADKCLNHTLSFKKGVSLYRPERIVNNNIEEMFIDNNDFIFNTNYEFVRIPLDIWIKVCGRIITNPIDELDKILDDYGLKITVKKVRNMLENLNDSFPTWIWELDNSHSEKLVEIILGKNSNIFHTFNHILANNMQKLCLHAGYTFNMTIRDNIFTLERSHDIVENQIMSTINNYRGNVHCCTVGGTGIIYVRRKGLGVWCGNSLHGQKGTCGILLKGSDMCHTKYGLTPDIILNPNAIPSRMTIGQIIECLMGKVACLKGQEADGTPFEPRNIEGAKDELKKLGYSENGDEYLYNGMTGERINVKMFIGPTYYNRLKHMVQDKLHSRARGPRTLLTRQAPEGRSRDGGLRLGKKPFRPRVCNANYC